MIQKEDAIILSNQMAQKILERIKDSIDHNINIMNAYGVIVASSTPERVGSIHESAQHILTSDDEERETGDYERLIGTRQGINAAIMYHGQKVGVLGITGAPDEVRPFLRILKLTVETILASELEQQSYILKYSQRQHLESGFLYGNVSEDNLSKWAVSLALNTDQYRVPIIIRTKHPMEYADKKTLADELPSCRLHSAQDYVAQWTQKELVIFKAMEADPQSVRYWRDTISEYGTFVLEKLKVLGGQGRIVVGSFTNELGRYHEAYKRAQWVITTTHEAPKPIEFFYDHLTEWMNSFIPANELRDICGFFTEHQQDEKLIEHMLLAQKVLTENNFNFVRASQQIYIHKNTLLAWMDKVRSHYNIDPVQNGADRIFWNYLCWYYEKR